MMNSNKTDYYNLILEKRKLLKIWVRDNFIPEKNDLDDLYKTWVFETKKTVVKDIDFIEFLFSSKDFQDEIFYPARSIFENCLRIEYMKIISKDLKEKGIEIATKEFLRLAKRNYDIKKEGREVFENQFNQISKGFYGRIEDFKKMNDAFQPVLVMLDEILNHDKEKVNDEYFLYQGLCEASHGKIMAREKGSDFYGFMGVTYMYLDMIV